MADKERNALIPLPAGGLENIGSGPKSILSGMVYDALALVRVREKSLAAARFRIGDYEFRDPDYQQILIWAKALELEPEDFIDRLKDCLEENFDGDWPKNFDAALEVEDGSIVSLVWDFDGFPISSFEWVDGLRIKRIGFRGLASTKISLRLPSLNYLDCTRTELTELDLSAVPALTELWCEFNELVELDLSAVPALTELQCNYNQLVELDLSAVPALTRLSCRDNQLVELDLSTVPVLAEFECCGNRLVELDLSVVPALTKLLCSRNQLVELDLSAVPALTNLGFFGNQLVELDLSAVPALTWLSCYYNQLVELDLSAVPALTGLNCNHNKLVELDLSAVPALSKLFCHNNQLVELDIRGLGKFEFIDCDLSVNLIKLSTQNPRTFKT
jgi:Leucine-rich repeat (LRR) protein